MVGVDFDPPKPEWMRLQLVQRAQGTAFHKQGIALKLSWAVNTGTVYSKFTSININHIYFSPHFITLFPIIIISISLSGL